MFHQEFENGYFEIGWAFAEQGFTEKQLMTTSLIIPLPFPVIYITHNLMEEVGKIFVLPTFNDTQPPFFSHCSDWIITVYKATITKQIK